MCSDFLRDAWFVVGGVGAESHFVVYDIPRRTWMVRPCLPRTRACSGVCAVGDRLVVMGGQKNFPAAQKNDPDGYDSCDIDEYKLSTSEWTKASEELCEPRQLITACSDGNSAYGFGYNYSARVPCCVIERYSVGDKSTKMLANLRPGRSDYASTFANKYGAFFIAGGHWADQERNARSIAKYDVSKNTWSVVGKASVARYGLATLLLGDDLYIVGGRGDHEEHVDAVEVFNVGSGGKTRFAPDLLKGRFGCSIVALNPNVLCALGGEGSDNEIGTGMRTVEVLDVREGKWTTGSIVPDMPNGCYWFGFACL